MTGRLRSRRRILHSAFLVLISLFASACLTTRAADAKREPLVVPPAPPRVIAPAQEPEEPRPVSEPEPVPPLPRASRTVREAPRSETKPAPAAETAPAPGPTESESAVTPPPTAPPPELRTVETPDEAKALQLLNETISRAGRTLSTIDYRALPRPSQIQYDMAKRFIEQSEEAMKTRNYTAAQLMAEKAATIAKELAGR